MRVVESGSQCAYGFLLRRGGPTPHMGKSPSRAATRGEDGWASESANTHPCPTADRTRTVRDGTHITYGDARSLYEPLCPLTRDVARGLKQASPRANRLSTSRPDACDRHRYLIDKQWCC